jgi:hypothetical protein
MQKTSVSSACTGTTQRAAIEDQRNIYGMHLSESRVTVGYIGLERQGKKEKDLGGNKSERI